MPLPGLRIGTTVDPSIAHLTPRQFVDDPYYDDGSLPFWYSKTGVIVKWSLFFGLLLLVSAYLLIGYTHAKKRIARGLPPLAYHRWLVSRHQLARVDPRYAYPVPAGYSTYPPQQNDYGMYAMPPPVYDPNAPRPPMYYAQPSEAPPQQQQQQDGVATKVDPDQSRGGYRQPTVSQEEYEAPAGPPPAAATRPHETGSSNPFRD